MSNGNGPEVLLQQSSLKLKTLRLETVLPSLNQILTIADITRNLAVRVKEQQNPQELIHL